MIFNNISKYITYYIYYIFVIHFTFKLAN